MKITATATFEHSTDSTRVMEVISTLTAKNYKAYRAADKRFTMEELKFYLDENKVKYKVWDRPKKGGHA